jgi:hypothetical protein
MQRALPRRSGPRVSVLPSPIDSNTSSPKASRSGRRRSSGYRSPSYVSRDERGFSPPKGDSAHLRGIQPTQGVVTPEVCAMSEKVERAGIEPATSALQRRRSPS